MSEAVLLGDALCEGLADELAEFVADSDAELLAVLVSLGVSVRLEDCVREAVRVRLGLLDSDGL